MDRISLIGAFGFLGSHLTRAFELAGYGILPVGRQSEMSLGAFCDQDGRPVRAIVFLATTLVPASGAKSLVAEMVGPFGWLQLAMDWCAIHPDTTLVFVSSGGEVHASSMLATTERTQTKATSLYGQTKLLFEMAVEKTLASVDASYYILRPGNIYGPGQRLDKPQGVVGRSLESLYGNKPIQVWADPGTQRDYVFVEDFCRAVLSLTIGRAPSGLYNVGSGVGTSLRQVWDSLGTITGIVPSYELKQPLTEATFKILNSSKLRAATGWIPHVSIEEGLERTVRSFRSTSKEIPID